jgi:hypothetical protein
MLSNSRQSLVKGERLVRHDMTAVLNDQSIAEVILETSDVRDGCEPTGILQLNSMQLNEHQLIT